MSKRLDLVLLLLLLSAGAHAERIRFELDGLLLNANLELSEGAESAWLIIHGTRAHHGMEIISALQQALLERGESSLAPTISLGVSNREGFLGCEVGWTAGERYLHAEIDAWLDLLRSRGVERFNLLGHSRGASYVLRYINARSPADVSRLVLVGPQVMKDVSVSPSDRTLGCAADAVADADRPRLSDVSYRMDIVLGSDDTVAVWNAEEMALAEAHANVRLHTIDGADHFFRDLYLEDLLDLVLEPSLDLSELDREQAVALYVSRRTCPYCRRMEAEVLQPLLRSEEVPTGILVRQLMLDDAEMMRDFAGRSTSQSAFAEKHQSMITPTWLFLNRDGKELAPRIVGYPGPEFYSHRLEASMAKAAYKTDTSPHR